MKKVVFALLYVFIVPIFGWPLWSVGGELTEPDTAEGVVQELKQLVSEGKAKSNDPEELRHLAHLYLDVGYGLYVDREKQIASLQEGARLAKKALELDESSATGHFLFAANFGKAAQLEGWVAAIRALGTLQYHANRVLEIDENHVLGNYMLGVMYEKLPWFLGGDSEKAGEYLKKTISLDARYAPAHLDLGKWYLKQGQTLEAKKEFMQVLHTPPREKQWIWKRIHRPEAEELLQQIGVSNSQTP